jgi:hypothetical protein
MDDSLKPPPLRVTRTASSVGHCDDLNDRIRDPVNYRVGKTSEEKFPRAMQVHGPTLRIGLDLTNGEIELSDKSIRGRGIAFGISLVGSLCLSDRVRMELNAWSAHRIVRGSGAAPPTRESSLLYPGQDHRCVAQFPYSMPIQHPHRLSHPSFQVDGRQALHAPRWEGATPLSRLFHDSASCLQVNRRIGFRQSIPITAEEVRSGDQSEDRQANRSDGSAKRYWRGRMG